MQRRDDDVLGVDLEVPAQCFARVAAAEAVGAQRHEAVGDPARGHVGDRLHPVAARDYRTLGPLEHLRHVRHARRRGGVQAVPALGVERVVAQFGIARGAPDVGCDVPLLREHLLRAQRLQHHRAAAEQLRLVLALGRGAVAVEALQDPGIDAVGTLRLRVVLVEERDVEQDVLAALVHAAQAVLDDRGQLVGERRIVGDAVGHGRREQHAVAVLVLQAFAVQRRAARRGTEHEAASAGVAEAPDLVHGPLEAEHGVEDVERDRGRAVRGVAGARGGERRHRAGLGDALFEHLAVVLLGVRQHQLGIDRIVLLAARLVDTDLAEQHFEAERARLVGDDRHHELAVVGIADHVAQQLAEHHRRRHLLRVAGARVELGERLGIRGRQRLRAHDALGHAAA